MKCILATIVLAAALLGSAQAGTAARPNILSFLPMTMACGYSFVGCSRSDEFKNKTPHLDGGGVRHPLHGLLLSAAMRAFALRNHDRRLRLPHQRGDQGGAFRVSFKAEPSVARTLKQAGYATGMAGKWRQMGDTPADWGFEEYITDPTPHGWYWEKSYTKNGQLVETKEKVYYPNVCVDFALDFFQRHRDQPFFFYYPMHLVHTPILRTPDSKAGTTDLGDLYEDNVAYLDKQVGKLVQGLERLGLREKTVIVFAGDNGTAALPFPTQSTIGGREINGTKFTLLEGGSRVPLIVSWKGTSPEKRVLDDFVDFSDFFATFAELAAAKLPQGVTFDSRSLCRGCVARKATRGTGSTCNSVGDGTFATRTGSLTRAASFSICRMPHSRKSMSTVSVKTAKRKRPGSGYRPCWTN